MSFQQTEPGCNKQLTFDPVTVRDLLTGPYNITTAAKQYTTRWPPKPAFYRLRQTGYKNGLVTYDIEFCEMLRKPSTEILQAFRRKGYEIMFSFVTSTHNQRIACVNIRNPIHQPPKFTILYSQCNCTDLGWTLPELLAICQTLYCDLVAYDYSGYGQSDGRPKESNVYCDIAAVYDFAVDKLLVPQESIIAWGFSLGSAASIDLACRRPLKALILHSTFPSALRIAF
ncbi:unnamed protein product, partial [Soboliphyme baturini]|uniref:Protein ABHD13 n=1 Tax=Soboliphyme baturini TaxID=241478 RepID=A0A183IAI2_9BILA